MQELPTLILLGPAVHRGKDTSHNARAWPRGCNISEFKQRRRRRQRERQKKKKAIGLDWQNNGFAHASRFVEDGNIRQRVSFSFPELWYSLLEFSSRKSCLRLRSWTRWTKRETVWSRATLLFSWRFRSRRRRCCLSALLLCYALAITEQKKCLELLAQTFDRF